MLLKEFCIKHRSVKIPTLRKMNRLSFLLITTNCKMGSILLNARCPIRTFDNYIVIDCKTPFCGQAISAAAELHYSPEEVVELCGHHCPKFWP
eukprot:scaffold377774_cov36-Prasinocladus_malaysianus.AAC.1